MADAMDLRKWKTLEDKAKKQYLAEQRALGTPVPDWVKAGLTPEEQAAEVADAKDPSGAKRLTADAAMKVWGALTGKDVSTGSQAALDPARQELAQEKLAQSQQVLDALKQAIPAKGWNPTPEQHRVLMNGPLREEYLSLRAANEE